VKVSYLVFARKWRPKNFDEVLGQEHIATTLKNAISLKRVAHAYLFSGPRGIGKTSMARILARALNCEKGPTPSPCNSCELCREISDGRSLDVIEIDGASNRGIEQVRQLRESVKFAAAKSHFRVYIIDEVHQITTDGFNALLKTLEEPPAHVKFIFATTQPHKVLPTILSRCQRFDFKPLSTSSIVDKLKRIIRAEKLEVTEEALLYIARSAAGSMRDAESILDQLVSFCRGRVELETVTRILGMVDLEILEEIAQKIIARQMPEALTLIEKIINEGKDLSQFIASLMGHFRNILITKVSSKNAANLIDLPSEYVGRIAEQAKLVTVEEIFYIFNILVRTQESLRRALSSRVLVEMAIVRLTQRENLSSLGEILARLSGLEQRLGQAQPQNDCPAPAQDVSPAAEAPSEKPNPDWSNFLEAIRKEKMFVASTLELGKIASLEDRVLNIAFPEKYHFYKETLEQPQNIKLIEAKAKEIFGRDLKVNFILDKNFKAVSSKQKQQLEEESSAKTSTEPIIKAAQKIFQGRLFVKRNSQ